MRYYGEDYLNELCREINGIYTSVDKPCFTAPIKDVDVSARRSSLKSADISIAQSAGSHIDGILDKLMKLYASITSFYGEVDVVSSGITKNAGIIKEMLKDATASLNDLSSMLSGTGSYAGVKITSEKIMEAKLDKTKYSIMAKTVWEYIIDTQISDDRLNDEAAAHYLDYVKSRGESEELTSDEYKRLKNMYQYYVDHRFGGADKIDGMDPATFKNAVDTYEVLDPRAKTIMDRLFNTADPNMSDSKRINVQRIKYATYTADPKYRDTIIYYSGKGKIGKPNDGNEYNDLTNTMLLDMEEDTIALFGPDSLNKYRYCSFFHELGHQVDDLSDPFGNYSKDFDNYLCADLRAHMVKVAQTEGPSTITTRDRDEVIDFIISSKNINVKPGDHMPDNWSNDQRKLFNSYRDYYGYTEYTFLEDSDDGTRYDDKSIGANGADMQNERDHAVISDIVGGVTNNQIGGHQSSHTPDIPYDSSAIKNEEKLKSKLENYDYWYKSGKPSSKLGTEFVAECFELSVLGSDLSGAGKIFGDSCDQYNKFIDDTYASLPDEFKNKGF